MKRIKFYKHKSLSLGSEIINPILPRMDAFDGISSLLNLTGNYYPTAPHLDKLCRASKHISTTKTVWMNIANDIDKSIADFSSTNQLPKATSYVCKHYKI